MAMTFEELWKDRNKLNDWLQAKRLAIVPDRYIGL